MQNHKNMGGSLPVENVQALASKNLQHIPLRYVRSELEFDEVCIDDSLQIPVIDMSKFFADQSTQETELAELRMACENWGFFQLVNHGMEEQVIEKMKMDLKEFFKLPLEEKMAYSQLPNDIQGYGQAFVVSEDQKLDWGDMFFLLSQPPPQRNMKLWPTNPTSFRATLDKYSSELQRISICLVRLMAKTLEVDPEKVTSMFEDGIQGIRMNYYPPCIQASKVIGLNAHSDATGLTLLTQANEVQGLQIKKNGKWVPIKPIPGAFIVNVGDIIEIMSNGQYKSIEHRAVVNQEKARLSIAAFHSPNMKTLIGPLEDLAKEKDVNYKTFTHEEYVKLVVASKLDGKKLIIDHLKH